MYAADDFDAKDPQAMNIFLERFSTGQVTAAAGITNPGLQSWLRRGYVIGHAEESTATIEGAGSPGLYRRFSFHTVMQLAIAKALTDCSQMGARDALYAGGAFAHTGDVYMSETHPSRVPGVPFDPVNDGQTMLAVACQPDGYPNVTEVPRKVGTDIYPILRHLLRSDSFVLVLVNPIFERVVGALGHDHNQVLTIAYADERASRRDANQEKATS